MMMIRRINDDDDDGGGGGGDDNDDDGGDDDEDCGVKVQYQSTLIIRKSKLWLAGLSHQKFIWRSGQQVYPLPSFTYWLILAVQFGLCISDAADKLTLQ